VDPLGPSTARRFRVACGWVALWRWLVPSARRDDWRREWEGELWHRLAAVERHTGRPGSALDLAARLSGVVPHAFRLRRNQWRLDMIAHDLLFAWRTMLRRPGFALLVTGTLGLGIAANTAMFSVVNAVLVRPLPYPDPDRLVFMYGSFDRNPQAAMSAPDFEDYRSRTRTMSSFAARTMGDLAVLTSDGPPERVDASRVSAAFFPTLGVKPLYGRLFRPDEERGGGHDVAILSYGLWQRRFGGDPAVVGRTTLVGGRATQIIGVLPRQIDQSLDFDLWQPLELGGPETTVRRFHSLRGLGRLRPGVTLAEAQADFDVVARQLASTYPENEGWHLALVPYREVVVGPLGRALVILLAAVGLVLLIACGNVANLLLSRAAGRQGEIVIRTALGASRHRLVRQLLTESLLLAVTGGVLGLALATVLVRAIRVATSGILPRLADVAIDPAVLGFTAVISLLTGIVFGLAPALHTARSDMTAVLASLGRGSGRGLRGRDLLVALQVALSMVLLVGSGLLVRSLIRLGDVETGFDPAGVFTANVYLPRGSYPDHAAQSRFWSALADRLRTLPGVSAAAVTTRIPMVGGGDTYFWPEDRPPATPNDRSTAMVVSVSDDYFRTLAIPLVAGRFFGPPERAGGPGAVIINRGMAAHLFPDGSPIGRRLVTDFGSEFPATIVGVVGDVRSYGPAGPAPDVLYFSGSQPAGFGLAYLNAVVKTDGDPSRLAAPVRAAVAEIDPNLALAAERTMADVVGAATSAQRFSARLLAAFAIAAVLLAVIGLYGALAYAVAQRSREIGIRLALGADRRTVFGMVVRRGLAVVGAGVVVGTAGALGASRLLESQLFQVRPTDPLVYGVVVVTLVVAGAVAAVVPARRATRVDPLVALRAPG
jgi:putative ABC transport system permease protein